MLKIIMLRVSHLLLGMLRPSGMLYFDYVAEGESGVIDRKASKHLAFQLCSSVKEADAQSLSP